MRRVCTSVLLVLLLLLGGCNSAATSGGVLSGGRFPADELERVATAVSPSVVRVEVTGCGFTATGTGFFIGPGRVVTNRHVVESASTVAIRTNDGVVRPAVRWESSSGADVAVVAVAVSTTDSSLRLGTTVPVPGDRVAVIGYPLGGSLRATEGRVVPPEVPTGAVGDISRDGPLIGATAEVLPGNSGGPLLDHDGSVVGLVFAFALNDSKALAMTADTVRASISLVVPQQPATC